MDAFHAARLGAALSLVFVLFLGCESSSGGSEPGPDVVDRPDTPAAVEDTAIAGEDVVPDLVEEEVAGPESDTGVAPDIGPDDCDRDEDCLPFDDGDFCNGIWRCIAHECEFAPESVVECASDGDTECAHSVCDPADGSCGMQPRAEGEECAGDSVPPGAMWRCQEGVCAVWECTPDCEGRECGDDGCGGTCGDCSDGCVCDESGQCLGTTVSAPLDPECVHVPPAAMVETPFVLALYGHTTGCTSFESASADVAGGVVAVTVTESTTTCGECPACLWSWVAMVPVTLPAPGSYDVTLNGASVDASILATLEAPTAPECDEDCPVTSLAGTDWTLSYLTSDLSTSGCGEELYSPVTISGSCQSYELSEETHWTLETDLSACRDSLVLFGTAAPYATMATRCMTQSEIILGVSDPGLQGSRVMPQVFVLERY